MAGKDSHRRKPVVQAYPIPQFATAECVCCGSFEAMGEHSGRRCQCDVFRLCRSCHKCELHCSCTTFIPLSMIIQ
jgi:hypothetical protein